LIAAQPSLAQDAAHWLLDSPSSSVLARRLADAILRPPPTDSQDRFEIPYDTAGTDREVARERIQILRSRLAHAPNDPMAWAELARQHTVTGSTDHALDAMRIAVAAAPSDRYLLRAAARLHHHAGNTDKAHNLLVRAPRTPTDPWLIAAELAFAELADRRPRFVKAGRRMLDSGLAPRHLTELASALGTLQLESGQTRRARQLFRQALVAPNDNSLAQVEWALPQIGLSLDAYLHTVSASWEARALAAASAHESAQAVVEAWGWFFDQPFASEPAVFGSYHAAKARQFDEGAKLAAQGVAANPELFMLRNNLAFCLAKLDRVSEARDQMQRASLRAGTPAERATSYATEGLVAFRSGDLKAGESLYAKAIRTMPDARGKLLALINFAAESSRVDPETGRGLALQARDQAARQPQQHDMRDWLGHLAPDA